MKDEQGKTKQPMSNEQKLFIGMTVFIFGLLILVGTFSYLNTESERRYLSSLTPDERSDTLEAKQLEEQKRIEEQTKSWAWLNDKVEVPMFYFMILILLGVLGIYKTWLRTWLRN